MKRTNGEKRPRKEVESKEERRRKDGDGIRLITIFKAIQSRRSGAKSRSGSRGRSRSARS